MAKQDWTTRRVWVIVSDRYDEIDTEVFDSEAGAMKAIGAAAYEWLSEHGDAEEREAAGNMWQGKDYHALHEFLELAMETRSDGLWLLLFENQIKR